MQTVWCWASSCVGLLCADGFAPGGKWSQDGFPLFWKCTRTVHGVRKLSWGGKNLESSAVPDFQPRFAPAPVAVLALLQRAVGETLGRSE